MLAPMTVSEPAVPVYANRTAAPYTAGEAKALLSAQASGPVRWQQTIEHMAEAGADAFVEFGPGTTLAGLVKRTLPGAKAFSVSDPETLRACLAGLL